MKEIISYIIISLLIIQSISCNFSSDKEIIIKLGEIGVKNDYEQQKTIVLKEGKYNVKKEDEVLVYALEKSINDNFTALTNEYESIRIYTQYEMKINPENILELHNDFGVDYNLKWVNPQLRYFTRQKFERTDFEKINVDSLSKIIFEEYKSNDRFSSYIELKSFKIVEIEE